MKAGLILSGSVSIVQLCLLFDQTGRFTASGSPAAEHLKPYLTKYCQKKPEKGLKADRKKISLSTFFLNF
jgi:hypothetical protein